MASASSTAVWSFHSTNMALGLSANSSRSASTLPSASIGAGVEPVLSTPIPTTRHAVRRLTMPTHFSARLPSIQCSRADGGETGYSGHRKTAPPASADTTLRWWPAPRRWRIPLPVRVRNHYQNRGQSQLPCCYSMQKTIHGETVDIHAKTVRPYSLILWTILLLHRKV